MEGITFDKPVSFAIPQYDFGIVKAFADITDLSKYYDNLLDDAFTRDEEDFTYGVSPNITKKLVERVKHGFSWGEWEQRIKDMGDHYKLKVSGIEDQGEIDVHFVHRKSPKPDAIPLLLVHGWPGSFLEFEQICQSLGKNYHVVMPSIPGFTFSGTPKKGAKSKGGVPWNYSKTAQCFNAVMLSLGYTKYVTQGGDWGSMLTRHTAQLFPDNVKAVHINYFSGVTTKPDSVKDAQLTDEEKRGIERLQGFRAKGSAYQAIQGTVPYTIGGALSASPLAVIIYIGEKFYRWSSPHSHPSLDFVIANCLLYWFTGSVTSSFWLYYMRVSGDESQHNLLEKTTVPQPLAFGCGRYEIHWPTKAAFEMQIPNIQKWQVLEAGGHFLALEQPELLAKDIDDMFQREEVKKLVGVHGKL